jgi:hypothetical protein
MSKLAEFRKQYPQYDDMSDEALAEGLHAKFYNDLSFDDFSDKIGLRKSGFVSSVVGGTKRFISSGQTALESLTGSPEEAAIAGGKRLEQINTENAPAADFGRVSEKYEKEGPWAAAKEVAGQVPSAIAEMAPFMGATLGGAKLGAMAGSAIAPGPGTIVGGLLGAAAPSLLTRYGGNIEVQAAADQAEGKPVEISRTAALGAAVPQAALDVAANTIPILGRTAIAKVLGPRFEQALGRKTAADFEKVAAQTLKRRIAGGVGENLAVQGVIQPAQVMITRLQAGQDLLSPEAINEYGHALYMAGLVSPIGAYGGIKERGVARARVDERNLALDNARQKLAEKIDAAKPAPDAPDPSMGALNIQQMLGVTLSEAKQIRRDLKERGDLIPGTQKGDYAKLFLNRDNLVKPEETAKAAEEAAAEPTTTPYTGEQLLGDLVERPPEQPTAPPAAATGEATVAPPVTGALPTETPPVVRRGKQQKPPAERITSPENPVFQAGAQLVKTMSEAGTPITPDNFRNAITPIVGELPRIQIGNLLGALTKNNVLSKPDENRVRTYTAPPDVASFQPTARETVGESNINQLGRGDVGVGEPVDVAARSGVEPPVQGGQRPAGVPEVDIAGRVEDVREPAAVAAAPEGRVEPALREQIEPPVAERVEPPVVERVEPPAAPRPQTIPVGEPVPRSAQPSSPDVFAPTPEQARISTEVLKTTPERELVPGRAIERIEAEREAQREKENAPEEGASARYDSVAESLRAGNLGEALYRLRTESEGKSPLSWLADKLLNVVQIKDDRSAIIKAEVTRIARERGIDKRREPFVHEALAKEVERAIMSDIDLTKYRFVDADRNLTDAGKLRAEQKVEVERMAPVTKGRARFNRETNRLEFILPEEQGKLPEPVYNRTTGKMDYFPEEVSYTVKKTVENPETGEKTVVPETRTVKDPETGAETTVPVTSTRFVARNPLAPAEKVFTIDDLPKPKSPFKNAFGGAKVFVEGNANLKGQHKAVVERLKREGKLAEYNPKTNAFYFTEAGLTDRVILHEMTHSATVDVMKKFLSRQVSDLTRTQLDGAKEIVDIYNDTKAVLGDKFKNAYENEYEFITYATTNEGFQRALSNLSAPKTAREKLRSAWDSFTLAVAKMVGLDKFAQQAKPNSERIRAADTMDNALLTVISSVGDILTVPKAGVEVQPLAARRPGRVARRRRAPTVQPISTPSTQTPGSTKGTFISPTANTRPGLISYVKHAFTSKGFDDLVFNLQNHRRYFLTQEEGLRRANQLRRGINGNNTNERMTLAMGRQETNENSRVTPLKNTLREKVAGYANKVKMSSEDALEHLGVLRMAMNELEKRTFKYLEIVPLDDAPVLTLNNQPISPAAYRDALFNYVTQNRDLVTNGEARRIRQQLETLAQRYAKVGGKSRGDRVPSNATDALDINSNHYRVVGYDNSNLNAWRRTFAREMRRYGPEIKEVFDAVDAINEARITMEKEGKYWTQPVDNLKELYGYEYYVPFKGMDKGTADISFDLDSNSRAGVQFRQLEDRAMGRSTGINNPMLQIVQDLHRASARSASDGITESIKNQILDKDLDGKLVERVTFDDKFNGKQREDLSKHNVFFHHMPDGSTEVYALRDRRMVEGLNGFNTDINYVLGKINNVTHLMGKMHTFYNLGFAPYNFVRDTLTNAYNSAGMFGPTVAPKIIGAVARNIVESGGFTRAMKISWLYNKGDFAAIKNMRGQFAKNAYEYLVEEGGRGSFQKSFDIAALEEAAIGPKRFVSKENVDRLFTTWADAFEFVSRASTYGVIKNELASQGRSRGLNVNDPVFQKAVKEEAAGFTKNLFNYEQVGKYGRELGAMYMFMRPSLTSAVRVMDVMRPAFESVDSAMDRGSPLLKITDPADPKYAQAEAARKEFKANFAKEKRNALLMGSLLAGAGMLAYQMALGTADKDSQGRNKVATDDMSMWTRALRVPMKFAGEANEFLQIPWGFGGGAFAAFGAQMAAWMNGHQTGKEMLENLVPITLDSFMPIPAPRFSPIDKPAEFILDTVAFTAMKPLVEFAINTDGLGREIYNDRVNKYGDAYSAGLHVPKWTRDISSGLMDLTAGWETPVQVNPQTIAYLVGNYLDAVGKFAGFVKGTMDIADDEKNFDIKTELPLVGSFVGKRSSVDSRKFADLRDEMEEKQELINAYKDRPQFEEYIRAHPQDYLMTELYKTAINGRLKELQSQEKAINAGAGFYSNVREQDKQLMLREIRAQKEYVQGEFVKSVEALKAQAKAGLD